MAKIDLQSQIVLTVVGLLVTAALVFVGISFLGMQDSVHQLTVDVTTLQSLQTTSSIANAEAFKEVSWDLLSVKTDLKIDIRELKGDIKDLWRRGE